MKKFLVAAALASAMCPALQAAPDALYLVGSFNGWLLPTADYVLQPVDGAEGVYSGTFDIYDSSLEFKIFTVNETNWDNSQLYYGCEGAVNLFGNEAVEVNISHDMWSNIAVSNWTGGTITVSADLNTNKVTLLSPTQPVLDDVAEVYLIGTPQGWDINNGEIALTKADDQKFTTTLTLPAGTPMFRFYSSLGDWNTGSIGSGMSGDKIVNLNTDTSPTTMAVQPEGQGNWSFPAWPGGTMDITLDLKNASVTFTPTFEGSYHQPVIYMVGSFNWDINNGTPVEYLPNEADEAVYRTQTNIPAGGMLRFYTELGDWDKGSYGPAVSEADTPFTIPDSGELVTDMYQSKANWNFPDWQGGKMEITVNLTTRKATFKSLVTDALYLVGSPQGWDIMTEDDTWTLWPDENASGKVYTGTFDIPADAYFRFYRSLGDFNTGSLGARIADGDNEIIEFQGAPSVTTPVVEGAGCWNFPTWASGNMIISVDLDNMTVTFTDPVASSIDEVTISAGDTAPEYFNLQGIRVTDPTAGHLYIRRTSAGASKIIF